MMAVCVSLRFTSVEKQPLILEARNDARSHTLLSQLSIQAAATLP